ncbi:MAG: hypothetical protein V4607_17705 [Pseudomonadota bacterium]
MLKKILISSAATALLTASFAASAVTVYPVSGSIKLKTTASTSAGGAKIISATGDSKKLIRLAMGGSIDFPVVNEKNLLVAYAADEAFTCSGDLVVWNKGIPGSIVGHIARINNCSGLDFQVDLPAPGKAGTLRVLNPGYLSFPGTADNCSSVSHSQLSNGFVYGLIEFSGKNTNPDPTSLKITRLVGDVADNAEGTVLTIIDGSYSVNLAKPLGNSSVVSYVACQQN